jgi:hypothetical protein
MKSFNKCFDILLENNHKKVCMLIKRFATQLKLKSLLAIIEFKL